MSGSAWSVLRGCRGNRLQGIDVAIPRVPFTCVTGVSGTPRCTAARAGGARCKGQRYNRGPVAVRYKGKNIAEVPISQVAGSSMPINSNKPHLWKADIVASVDLFNEWFMEFAPLAFRNARQNTTRDVERAFNATNDLKSLGPAAIAKSPQVLQVLRMCTCPPIARDRLVGLADANRNLVKSMEEKAKLPPNLPKKELAANLARITEKLSRLLDPDLFPWLESGQAPGERERERAATIVADRLCGALSNPIIRNEQERRQLAKLAAFLQARTSGSRLTRLGYRSPRCCPGRSASE